MKSVIKVSDFQKNYGQLRAVKGISFEVAPGEIFGLLGPNGAGKTSILECLEGLRIPNGGSIEVLGLNPVGQAEQLYNQLGVQLQSAGLPDSMQVDEAMKFFCAYHRVAPRYDLLDRLGLTAKRKDQYFQLSLGQQRRLLLALAVAHNPAVLLLDEPTAGLDVAARVELHQMVREMQAVGTTIILATHDMAEAEELADRVAILLEGEIVATGTPLELTATGAGLTKVSVRTETACLSDTGRTWPGVKQHISKGEYNIFYSSDIAPTLSAVIGYIDAQQDSLIDLRVERPSLEDRFLEITNTGGSK
ncbi:MAG: ABC transporter ATP-binding protein [Halanaerobiales bacterium]|nr:ABC transporter ATP-binding protein [Halanaerobiales bacterium]